jgi:hypothetical protein
VWDAAENALSRASLASGRRFLFSELFRRHPMNSPQISLKELVEFLAKALVDKPDQVEVSELAGEQTVVFELKVAKDDLGKVIGKQGRTVKAIRAILAAASSKLKKRADLEILE